MAKASYVCAGPDDFGFIDPIAKGRKILFFGENPHYVPEIHDAVLRLALHLRKEVGYSLLGYESDYSQWPILEAQSLGSSTEWPKELPERGRIGLNNLPAWLALVRYNQGASADQQLPCITLDIDHCIRNVQPVSVRYFEYLASRSSSSQARAELTNALPGLVGLKDPKALHAWLDDVERKFRAAWNTFSPADQAELAYAFELERASIDAKFLSTWGEIFKYQQLRGKYFRKNIERAAARAEQSGGSLICYVGANHAFFTPRVRVGGDAGYIRQEYPSQVVSILVESLSKGDFTTCWPNWSGDFSWTALEDAALARMGDRDRVFVDLRDQVWSSVKHRPKRFFPKEGPSFDGVLFIK